VQIIVQNQVARTVLGAENQEEGKKMEEEPLASLGQKERRKASIGRRGRQEIQRG